HGHRADPSAASQLHPTCPHRSCLIPYSRCCRPVAGLNSTSCWLQPTPQFKLFRVAKEIKRLALRMLYKQLDSNSSNSASNRRSLLHSASSLSGQLPPVSGRSQQSLSFVLRLSYGLNVNIQ
uniref:Ovule protein n=1 Tax=Macrostomum lignano TaxID=282301 RepID=A0A1I8FHH9_9PLAT